MLNKIICIFVCYILCTATNIAFAEEETIKIGYLLDLSAKGAFMGRQSQVGARLAELELSAAGQAVQLIFEDHQTDPKLAVSAVRKLLSVDNVDAVLCDLTGPCTAVSPILKSARKILAYQAPTVSMLASNPYSFKNFLDYEEGCRKIANFWKHQGIVKVAHFKQNAEYGELCLSGSRKVFPDQEAFDYNSNDDLSSFMPRLKNQGIEAIFQTGYEGDYINSFKALNDLNLYPSIGLPMPLLTDSVLQQAGAKLLQSTITFGFPSISTDFINKLKNANLFNTSINIESAAIAYLYVIQVAEAVRSCPKADTDCQVSHISATTSDMNLGFKGWEGRIAVYDQPLRVWRDGKFWETLLTPALKRQKIKL